MERGAAGGGRAARRRARRVVGADAGIRAARAALRPGVRRAVARRAQSVQPVCRALLVFRLVRRRHGRRGGRLSELVARESRRRLARSHGPGRAGDRVARARPAPPGAGSLVAAGIGRSCG